MINTKMLAESLREHAQATKDAGEATMTFRVKWQTGFALADAVDRYLNEKRTCCYVCDQVRDWQLDDLILRAVNAGKQGRIGV